MHDKCRRIATTDVDLELQNGFQNYQFTAPLPDPELLITLTVTSGPPVSLYCGNNYERPDAYTALWKSGDFPTSHLLRR